MKVFTLLFVLSCGISIGILLGRHDERRKAAQRDAERPGRVGGALPEPPAAIAAPVPVATEPASSSPGPTEPVAPVDPVAADEPVEIEPAIVAALGDDPLAPPVRPLAAPNKKAKKVGLDDSAFIVDDDILERLRRVEELGVDPEEARQLLAREKRATAARPPRADPALAEAERRVLERLRNQPPAEDEPDAG